jgi:uncharacterized protein YmfQ (DUF2313 family)
MRATVDQYINHLIALLPQGTAWPRDLTSKFAELLAGFAGGLKRSHNRALDLIEEADPRTTIELLSDWERVCGLPDGCTGGMAVTLQERRAAVVAKLNERGGQSRAYFVSVGARLGYDVTITEFRPFTCDISAVGDRTYDEPIRHLWQVNAPIASATYFRAGLSTADEPLVTASNVPLECVFNRLKPAHSKVQFQYGEVI